MTKPLTALALPLLMTMMLSQAVAHPTRPEKKRTESSDRTLICQTLNYFFEGANMGSLSAVESACHPEAFFTELNTQTGQIAAHSVPDLLAAIKAGNITPTQNLRLINLEVEGNVALVKIRIEEGATRTRSVRYMQLVRVGDQWRIVNETNYRNDS